MAVKIEFETSNAAFAGTDPSFLSGEDEVAMILRTIADKIQNAGIGSGGGTIRDSDGNRIGSWSATIDAEESADDA